MTDDRSHNDAARTVKEAMAAHFAAAARGILAANYRLAHGTVDVSVADVLLHNLPNAPDITLAIVPIDKDAYEEVKRVRGACTKFAIDFLTPQGSMILDGQFIPHGASLSFNSVEFAQTLNYRMGFSPIPEVMPHLQAINKLSMAVIPTMPPGSRPN